MPKLTKKELQHYTEEDKFYDNLPVADSWRSPARRAPTPMQSPARQVCTYSIGVPISHWGIVQSKQGGAGACGVVGTHVNKKNPKPCQTMLDVWVPEVAHS